MDIINISNTFNEYDKLFTILSKEAQRDSLVGFNSTLLGGGDKDLLSDITFLLD